MLVAVMIEPGFSSPAATLDRTNVEFAITIVLLEMLCTKPIGVVCVSIVVNDLHL